MNEFWMTSQLWSWPILSISVSVFTLWPWCLGLFGTARDVNQKDVPDWIAGFFFINSKANRIAKDAEPDIRAAKIAARISKGIAFTLGAAFIMYFEIDLWINVFRDQATIERALLIQLTLFLPFLIFNLIPVYFFKRYLNRLP